MPSIPFFRCLLFTLALGVPASAWAEGPRTIKDLEFAAVDGQSLKLDLYLPAAENPPLVVWIHGGGWRAGSKARCQVSWLADHGYAVASISYRLSSQAIFPAQIHDCKAAVRWLRASSKKYGYSVNRIAVAGSSAGGHLAALLGMTGDVKELEGAVGGNLDQSSRVQAIVDYFGPVDFVLRTKSQPHKTTAEGAPVRLLLGGPADQRVELAQLASPVTHVTADDPPLLIFHGLKDNTVLFRQSQRMVDVYTRAKLPVILQTLENSKHGGAEFFEGGRRTALLEFLQRHQREPAATDGKPVAAP
ncbi:MAG: alpha/beta hydrolase [Planctomycetales bacterium]|nr:alpha/beta hydrolase [Planctomycetales bacterium]